MPEFLLSPPSGDPPHPTVRPPDSYLPKESCKASIQLIPASKPTLTSSTLVLAKVMWQEIKPTGVPYLGLMPSTPALEGPSVLTTMLSLDLMANKAISTGSGHATVKQILLLLVPTMYGKGTTGSLPSTHALLLDAELLIASLVTR